MTLRERIRNSPSPWPTLLAMLAFAWLIVGVLLVISAIATWSWTPILAGLVTVPISLIIAAATAAFAEWMAR